MCGIAGKVSIDGKQPVDAGLIDRMLGVITHRGPDGGGKYVSGPVGLGHRRLSIIDLSDCGAQPMSNEDGTIWIVFNGEIYNYPELREQLLKRGHVFRSTTDTEVIVHLYEEHEMECLQYLRGMFALAIWDANRQRLFVARDRVGIKPLYYSQTSEAFWFSSELKSILADSAVTREINQRGIRRFLSFYYPAGEETLFQSIKKLPPGHYLTLDHGKLQISQYWNLEFTKDRWGKSFEDCVEELHGLLKSTVKDHMIADVPVGILLSGGMDSTSVLNLALQGSQRQIRTFTIGFDGGQVVDERPYARLAAGHFGTSHHDLSIDCADFWKFLPDYVWHMEEPVCEPPAVALYYISRLARQHVKVLLSGEGGDEAFAGYSNYLNLLRLAKMRDVAGPLARPIGRASGALGSVLGEPRLLRYANALGVPFSSYYFSLTSGPTFYFNREARSLFTREFLGATDSKDATAFVASLATTVKSEPLLNQMLFVDTKTWLPDDLLIKADKMTMANSLELRVPLLDHKVLEFAASLPPQYKVQRNQTKRVLKAAFAKHLPMEILARKKAGFPVPYGGWLRNGLAEPVRDILLSRRADSRGYFERKQVEQLLQTDKTSGRFSKEVFSLLILELWHKVFIDNVN